MSVFFTADTHFGHGNIIKYCNRPFVAEQDRGALRAHGNKWHEGDWKGPTASKHRMSREAISMMNKHLIDNINATVGTDDTLWHLGDWAFAPDKDYARACEEYRGRIKCKNIHIIWGNHDKPKKIKHLFISDHTLTEVKIQTSMPRPVNVVLCHYALAVWNKSHRGSWQLYGHSHSGAEPWMNQHMNGRRSIDVGVDNAKKHIGEYRPFSTEELTRLLGSKLGHSMDHHIPKNSKAPSEEELT